MAVLLFAVLRSSRGVVERGELIASFIFVATMFRIPWQLQGIATMHKAKGVSHNLMVVLLPAAPTVLVFVFPEIEGGSVLYETR